MHRLSQGKRYAFTACLLISYALCCVYTAFIVTLVSSYSRHYPFQYQLIFLILALDSREHRLKPSRSPHNIP